MFIVSEDRNFITIQLLKKLNSHYQQWAMSPQGWRLRPRLKDDAQTRRRQVYDLGGINLDDYYEDTFYMECLTDETACEEHIIVTYCRKYYLCQKQLRARKSNVPSKRLIAAKYDAPNRPRAAADL